MLLGDFNAHNPIWGSSHISPRGTLIENLISNHPLSLLNHPAPTYLCSSSGSSSSIDLSICSHNLSSIFQWDTSHETHGSDHYPIIIRLPSLSTPSSFTSGKLNLGKADWVKFSLAIKLPSSPVQNTDLFISEFTTNILEAAKSSIPEMKSLAHKPPVPWWTKECAKAIRLRKSALNLYKRHPIQENFINFKKLRAQAKRIIKQAKINSWRNFTSSLKHPISSKELWHSIKKMRGSNISCIPVLLSNNTHISDPDEICNVLASHFQSKSLSSSTNTISLSPPLSSSSSSLHHYNIPFSLLELNSAISQSKKSAPGPDSIHSSMIQHLPLSATNLLLEFYNHLWLNSCFPTSWLQSIIIPIHKAGKPRSLLDSYRPISLTSHLCKIMERMVLYRLNWHLEKNNLLSPFQYGFRKFRSTSDHLASLDTDIKYSLHRHHHLGLVSLDLTNAFDITNKNVIYSQFNEMGFDGALPGFIRNFLQPRSIKVKANGHISDSYLLSLGVPQGSVLSPTLFNIAMRSLTGLIPQHIKYKLFADDLIIYYSSSSTQDVTSQIQFTLNVLQDWADTNGFSFSSNKSCFLHFCKSRNCSRLNPLTINGSRIPSSNSHSILGLVFDTKLNWNAHIVSLRSRTTSDLNLLRLLAHTKWGSDFVSLINIYKSLILPKLKYGDFIYDSASLTHKRKLDSIQNQALRLATGAFRTSPIPSLQCISSIPPLYLTRQLSLLKYYINTLYRPHLKLSLNLSFIKSSCNPVIPPNSIPSRIKHLLTSHNLSPPRFDYSLYTSFPPWQSSSLRFDLSMSSINREVTPNKTLRAIYQDKLKNQYHDHEVIYTDGSKSSTGVGAAFVINHMNKIYKLPNHLSICSAELLAIKEGIRFAISSLSHSRFLIASDSLSAIQAIKQPIPEDAYTKQIRDLLYVAKIKNKFFSLIWIPSHSGIEGNEKADMLAKNASQSGVSIQGDNHPRDYIKVLSLVYRNLFQLQWELEDPNNKLWELKQEVFPPLHYPSLNRKENTTLRRLAIGHTFQTHSFLLNRDNPPQCPTCHSPITVKHIFEAQHLSVTRNKYNIPSCLKAVIGNYSTIHNQLGEYLKDINFRV